MNLQHVFTEDGSSTFFIPELNEHYHSTFGAIQESMHIFIREGYEKVQAQQIRIFEAGFGTGLNAFLTLLTSGKDGKTVHYSAIEKYPVEPDNVLLLNYPEKTDPLEATLFAELHACPWNLTNRISEYFTLKKIQGDLLTEDLPEAAYDLVYFDAFGPMVQPELCTEKIFRKLYRSMTAGALLVTYSVKGSVKRALNESGFSVSKLPGPPGKREMMRAIKNH
jgi:tRNA U34 5-methylaminomethyl-2-thiouridine-forming methyltransferase MnmC